jgi:(2Fe-2S) ferredoxin
MNRKGLEKKAATRGGNHYHVIFCAGKPKGKGACCDSEEGMKVWKYLGKRMGQLRKQGKPFYRTLTDCLCLCVGGPVMVVYPEGVWYGEVTVEACEKIIEEHLVNGRIATEYVLAVNPLVPKACPKTKKESKK